MYCSKLQTPFCNLIKHKKTQPVNTVGILSSKHNDYLPVAQNCVINNAVGDDERASKECH